MDNKDWIESQTVTVDLFTFSPIASKEEEYIIKILNREHDVKVNKLYEIQW